MSALCFTVEPEAAGERLDHFLARRSSAVGRRGAADLVKAGAVRVNGRRAEKSRRLVAGDVVSIERDPARGVEPEPQAALDVRLEREDLVVVDKPAGQPTAPLAAGEHGTLANALVARYPEMQGIGHRPREPGLLHRLDTETSGLVVAARTRECFERLSLALGEQRWHKRYLAIVEAEGLPDHGEIELGLEVRPRGSGQVVASAEARPRRSRFVTLERHGAVALVEVSVERAFRHQVRVHLSASGFPIVGDRAYGGRVVPELGARHALHASQVAWAGDERVPAFTVDSTLPADLRACLRSLAR